MSNTSKKKLIVFSLLIFCLFFMLSVNAYAETESPYDVNAMTEVLCRAMNVVTGGIGKTFAAFAIIALGIGFFGGKVSYAAMIAVTLGIAAMFGAPAIVNLITGGDFSCTDVLP